MTWSAAWKLNRMFPWLSIAPFGFAVVPEVWITVATSPASIDSHPSRHSRRVAGSEPARAMTSSKVSVPSGNLPAGSMVMTWRSVGTSARMASTFAACWAFSTITTVAPTLFMMNTACPGSDWG